MKLYRSLEHIKAVQYTGDPIPDVTCSGSAEEVQKHGCDPSRKHLLHVHTQAIGGMTVLSPGDWIYPVQGGPFAVAKDARFRGHWEVPVEAVAPSMAEGSPEPFSGLFTPFTAEDISPITIDSGNLTEVKLPITDQMIHVDSGDDDPDDADSEEDSSIMAAATMTAGKKKTSE